MDEKLRGRKRKQCYYTRAKKREDIYKKRQTISKPLFGRIKRNAELSILFSCL
jgi:hypothetical protein